MELGFIGLGRMGGAMVERLLRGGHSVAVQNRSRGPVDEALKKGAKAAASPEELVGMLSPPRAVWIMLPAGDLVQQMIDHLLPHLSPGDVLIDGGNSNFRDSIRRAREVKERGGVLYLDAGTSGGIWGLRVGYCLMVGGEEKAFRLLEPALKTLAPEDGYLHAGPSGAGHFVKMVHNGIEYGMLQAYAEGFAILEGSELPLDLRKIAGLWNHGSVVRSWLLELAELALEKDADLGGIRGYVEDSGEGRWTVLEAIAEDVPAPVITLSLMQRFRSRIEDSYADKFIAALRNEFGGHAVKPT